MKKETLLEKVEGEVIDETKSYVDRKIKRKAIRLGEISVLIVLSFIMLSIGISMILAKIYPVLDNGYSYILLGLTYLLIGYFLKLWGFIWIWEKLK